MAISSTTTDMGHRWWAPRETLPDPNAAKPDPASRLAARAAALAAINGAPLTATLTVAAASQALRRALNRGEGEAAALQDALAAVIAEAGVGSVPAAVIEASWSLLNQGASTLASARERHQALALAAASWALSGRPCIVLAADDESALRAGKLSEALLDALGLRGVVIASDATAAQLRVAYAADVVHVPARRLAADLARDRRERSQGDASRLAAQLACSGGGGPPPLTRGLFTVLVDELDRVLFDDAVNAVLLSVPDDSNALGAAIDAACRIADGLDPSSDYELDHTHGLRWTAEGLQLLTAQIPALPPLWRSPERCELLMLQALFVRDRMQRGRDYAMLANGQVHIDESLVERLPDRAILPGLTQALQSRLKQPQSPITRATDRTSVLTLVAGAQRLGGVAAHLDGLAATLWSRHGLSVDAPSAQTAAWPVETEVLASEQAWHARLQQCFLNATSRRTRIYVLRHVTDAAVFGALPGAQGQPWVLSGLGPERAIAAMGLADGAHGHGPGHVLEIVFTEPLDSTRAEAAFLGRAADASGLAVEGLVLLQPKARWVGQTLGLLAPVALRLIGLWPKLAAPMLRAALRLLRWRAAGQQLRALAALALREQQLRLQLSFAGAPSSARPSAEPRVPESLDPSRRTP